MELTLSIIVPVYNVRPYLEKCVCSLLDQDLAKDEYEIILVDDGSTDGGEVICDEFANRESNVCVIHQTNQGLSVARNTGMGVAKGKYIQFVDSDDSLARNVLGTLVKRMEEQDLEILQFGFQRVVEGEEIQFFPQDKVLKMDIHEVMDGPSFMIHRLWYSCYACQFLVLKSFLDSYSLTFKPGIIFEDVEWTPRVMQKAKRASCIDLVVYYYLIRKGSITDSSVQKKIDARLSLIDDLKTQMSLLVDKRWYQGMIAHIVVSVVTSVSRHLFDERNRYLVLLKAKDVYPLSSFLANKKGERKIHLINLSPRIACFLIHVLNN